MGCQPTAYSIKLTAYSIKLTAYNLPPTTYGPQPTAYNLQHSVNKKPKNPNYFNKIFGKFEFYQYVYCALKSTFLKLSCKVFFRVFYYAI